MSSKPLDLGSIDVHFPIFLAIDVGGTNTRVAIGTLSNNVLLKKFVCQTKAKLLAELRQLEAELRECEVTIQGACFSLAGPVLNGRKACEITNYQGDKHFELEEFPSYLAPEGRTLLLNDLEATCHGIVAMEHPSSPIKLHDYFENLWSDDNPPDLHHDGKYCVLQVGTGLGGGSLLWSENQKSFNVVPLEPGHSLVHGYGSKHPEYEEEQKLFDFLAGKDFENHHMPEYESFASGKGLLNLYEYTSKGDKSKDAAAIAADAIKGDEASEKALELHYKYLARCACDVCIRMVLKSGVFLAGANVVSNIDWIRKHKMLLKEEFQNHPKRDWVAETPCYVQHRYMNFNIVGAISQAEIDFK